MSQKVPIVAIVGRANVGKSSLFNALIGRREAIVAMEPGTTRDRITAKATAGGKDFWLVDTAGMKGAEDEFELGIQEQIQEAADSASVILVVAEASVPITAEDRRVAKMALKSRKQVLLVVNKMDKNRKAGLDAWRALGIKVIIGTSTTQKTGITELLNAVAKNLPDAKIPKPSNLIRISILGRPNVGKSSLFNSLAAKQQALVAPQAGTTRDVNRLGLRYKSRDIEIADTAGIRRPGRIERGVEHFSVLRSMAAIEESDLCLLVMDSAEPNTQLDQKIAGMIKDAGKGLIIVLNKWDAVESDTTREGLGAQTSAAFPFAPWAPLVFTSAVSGLNVTKLLELALEIDSARRTKFQTAELNRWLRDTVDSKEPPPSRRMLPKLNYMVQEDDIDMPSFKIFGAHTKFLHWSYKRYLERRFRERWPLSGTPLKFWFIDKREG
ncbi:MAG TPA: ribosome biogenesis GTPase Der [Candidatus Saccharimonadales bacterium]|nr:ribosome biogenesis GTPase Der [Candidatus Saccharimonadales bacterium]